MRAPAAFVVHDSHRDSDKTADEAPQSNISEQTRSDEAANGHGVAIVKEDLESSMTEKHEKRGENEVPEDPQVPLPGAEKAGPQELRTWRVMLMIGASWVRNPPCPFLKHSHGSKTKRETDGELSLESFSQL